ncbi:hypothetical protein OGAPHI_004994 [Ogataea philodendri]|uniref:Lysophospholipase n=1 Tax=Ogataea philodendri TaxID=1378263 RepID=A0A9P8P0I0_9ASCO|nr:uncharacterized protein OGAPHI_004994 [Ogataea philodendri]KAH3663593.1 hypothetical protein OGAPHI_004994 [Ogataea philodendri]
MAQPESYIKVQTKVDVHSLVSSVKLQCIGTELSSNTTHLDTTKWNVDVRVTVGVDEHHTGLQLGSNLVGLGDVVGKQSSSKTVGGVVGSLDNLSSGFELGNCNNRTKDLFTGNGHVVGTVTKHKWTGKVSRTVVELSGQKFGTFLLSDLNVLLNLLVLKRRNEWTNGATFLEWTSHLGVFLGELDKLLHELVVDGLLHVKSRSGGTNFTLVVEDTTVSPFDSFLQVAVGKDNERRLTTTFQSDVLQVGFGSSLHDSLTSGSGSGEGNLVDVWVGGKGSTGVLTVTRNNVDHTFWETSLQNDLTEINSRQWGNLRRLEHHRVTGGQSRSELPCHHHEWEVPWNDRCNSTQWDRVGEAHLIFTENFSTDILAVDLVSKASVVLEHFVGLHNVSRKTFFFVRLSVVPRLQGGNQLDISFDNLVDLVEVVASLRTSEARPRLVLKSVNSSLDGQIDLLFARRINRGDGFPCGRVNRINSGVCLDPFVVDEQPQRLFDGLVVRSDSYAPGEVKCPSYLNESDYNTDTRHGLIRAATSLSDDEADWIEERDNITNTNLRWFLKLANLTDFDTDDFLDTLSEESKTNSSILSTPRIGLAFSGGGYRAMLGAAGQIAGLDNRTDGCYDHGVPILSSVSYIAGLSGGSWFLSSLAFNNWTSVQDILDQNGQDNAIWDLEDSILSSGGLFHTLGYWSSISDDIEAKKDAGYDITLTDPWGRALSHQFFPNLSDYGASMTFSSIREFPVFENHEMPFPIVVTDGRTPGTEIISENSTVFEINPFEMGSWDPTLYSFTDLEYIGTNVSNGKPVNDTCIGGFDNTGFVFGTSSSLFNEVLLELNGSDTSSFLSSLLEDFLQGVGFDDNDIADYKPNPFYGSEFASSKDIVTSESLDLVDGGEDYQNIPLHPLIQPERQIDIVFAYDNSYDTDTYWPNGTSLVYTYERQFSSMANHTAFPYVPDQTTFLTKNLTSKPTFFGCYSSNLTSLMDEVGSDHVPPLVVYIANRPYSYYTNTSTYKMSYSNEEKLGFFQNGFEVSTRNNLTADDEYRACIGCAILQRSRERLGLEMGDQCQRCFDEYCWDGTLDTNENDIGVNFTQSGLTSGDEQTEAKKSGAAKLAQEGLFLKLVFVEPVEDCLPCQVLGSAAAIGAGVFFGSGYLFKGDPDFKKNPAWWRSSVRGLGGALFALGLYRAGQHWLWDKDISSQPNSELK